MEEKSFNSNQKGTNKQYKLHLPGRVVFDSYDIFKDQHNEASYKLNDLVRDALVRRKFRWITLHFFKISYVRGSYRFGCLLVKDAVGLQIAG